MRNIDQGTLEHLRDLSEAGNWDAAVTFAREVGDAVRPEDFPAPALDRLEAMRAAGSTNGAAVFEAMNARTIRGQRAVRSALAEIARGDRSPLAGLTETEKVEKIMANKAGLAPHDAVDTLVRMGRPDAAADFRDLYWSELRSETLSEDARRMALGSHRALEKEKADAIAALRARHTIGKTVYEGTAYRRELAALEADYESRAEVESTSVQAEVKRGIAAADLAAVAGRGARQTIGGAK